jgi:hypothetical protein
MAAGGRVGGTAGDALRGRACAAQADGGGEGGAVRRSQVSRKSQK